MQALYGVKADSASTTLTFSEFLQTDGIFATSTAALNPTNHRIQKLQVTCKPYELVMK
jgi:hypothetical protein